MLDRPYDRLADAMTVVTRRCALTLLSGAGSALTLTGCGDEKDGALSPPPAPPPASRTWRMGFTPNPPRLTVQDVLRGIDLWSPRAEVALIHEELPWTRLLSGTSADTIIDQEKQQLVDYLRARGLALFYMLDLTNGLAREAEAPQLVAAGRSLTEQAVQLLARSWGLAIQRRLNPEYLGLAAETNLIRLAAPAPVYQAVRQVANDTAASLTAAGATSRRFISVQVETAWGRLGNPAGAFLGIDQDFADFPFVQALGLSSYPYLGWSRPADLPADYYSRLRGARTLPLLVCEGGWASQSVANVSTSTQIQADYIDRHATLLDSVAAVACVQLLFADLDLPSLSPPLPVNLPLFGSIGLADAQFNAKPALTRWDALHARIRA
jgi:hypothetical protein